MSGVNDLPFFLLLFLCVYVGVGSEENRKNRRKLLIRIYDLPLAPGKFILEFADLVTFDFEKISGFENFREYVFVGLDFNILENIFFRWISYVNFQ